MENNQLELKSINQLFDYSFFIPAYQRGYRWRKKQVTQLLEDIWQFAKRDGKSEGEFYCLQPIVVKKSNNFFEIIDGQQRLTTIFLIIKYLEDIIKIAFQNFSYFSPNYDTREDSKDFLDNVKNKTEEDANKNIDYFHIWSAYKTIKEWFENKENNINSIDFLNTLLKYQIEEHNGEMIDVANNVRVIWYEVNETENNNSIDIFTRLNIGKISLTNAELIKALFLQKGNFVKEKSSLKQIQIASEWDIIEKTLQDDTFWYFIYNIGNPLKYENRIEYVFDLMAGKTKDSEEYHTFYHFYEEFSTHKKNQKPDIDRIWLEIKQYFLTFEEWYKDYELFHYIGFLIDCGVSIITIMNNSIGIFKDEFKEIYLKKEIRKQVKCDIDKLEYGDKFVKKILVLFNIQTVLQTQKSDMRFPFHRYKTEDWDIEHVRSRTDKKISAINQSVWIDDILEYITGTTSLEKIKEYKTDNEEIKSIWESLLKLKKVDKIEENNFNDTYKLVQKYFKEDNQTEDKDDISNLALLDYATNRSYGNSFFPIKRRRIIENDSKGVFVPIATKNLFLKYYSKKLDEIMYWNNTDAIDYLEAIKSTLKVFLPKEDKL